MLADVVGQLAGVQRLERLHLGIPLAVGGIVLVAVLLYFIQNLRHTLVCFLWY